MGGKHSTKLYPQQTTSHALEQPAPLWRDSYASTDSLLIPQTAVSLTSKAIPESTLLKDSTAASPSTEWKKSVHAPADTSTSPNGSYDDGSIKLLPEVLMASPVQSPDSKTAVNQVMLILVQLNALQDSLSNFFILPWPMLKI